MSDSKELGAEALENITGGYNPEDYEKANDKWKRMANAAGLTYNTGKPCTKCAAVSNGEYSVYANKDDYFSGNNSVCLCYNCGHFFIYRHII